MKNIWNIFSFLLILSSLFHCYSQLNSNLAVSGVKNLKDDIIGTIDINVKYKSYSYVYIGLEKTIYFDTDFNDKETNYFNASDIEEKTSFNTNIVFYFMTTEKYKTSCRLWKPVNDTLKIICKIAVDYNRGSMDTLFIGSTLNYKSYKINIFAPSQPYFTILYPKVSIPFLYADEQKIKIEEGKESYELKFKFVEYNNENLYIYSNNAYFFLKKC